MATLSDKGISFNVMIVFLGNDDALGIETILIEPNPLYLIRIFKKTIFRAVNSLCSWYV